MSKELPQYIIDEHQRKTAVIVPVAQWEYIQTELEELDDIRAYDAAKLKGEESIPFDQAVAEIESDES